MPVPVMQVWIVYVGMSHWLVAVPMRMWFCDRPVMFVPVVLVVNMAVIVFKRVVLVFVPMALSEVQPKADAHQYGRQNELWCDWLFEQNDGKYCPDERRERIVGTSAGCAQMAQRENEHDETDAYTKKAERTGGHD